MGDPSLNFCLWSLWLEVAQVWAFHGLGLGFRVFLSCGM